MGGGGAFHPLSVSAGCLYTHYVNTAFAFQCENFAICAMHTTIAVLYNFFFN